LASSRCQYQNNDILEVLKFKSKQRNTFSKSVLKNKGNADLP